MAPSGDKIAAPNHLLSPLKRFYVVRFQELTEVHPVHILQATILSMTSSNYYQFFIPDYRRVEPPR